MAKIHAACAAVLTCVCASWAFAQDAPQAQPPVLRAAAATATPPAAEDAPAPKSAAPVRTIPLILPKGTPIQIALDKEVRVKNAGQPVHGKVIEAVYAFDRVVIPVGTEVKGRITTLEDISGAKRTLAAMDANFTPDHKAVLEFEELVLADGTHMTVHTTVTPGTGQVVEFVEAKEAKGVKDQAAHKVEQAKQQAKQTWNDAKKQITEPGLMHRFARFIYSQLPFHPHYLDAGALYSAELQEPLDFGSIPLTEKIAATIGRRPAIGSVVHARLLSPLDSATAKAGDPIEAVLSKPLFEGDDLILPTGSTLKGAVLQASPASKPHHNGQLRIVFHQLQPPEGLEQRVNAVPVGVAAARAQHVELDSEGGAEATSPKTRYIDTTLAVGLAASSALSFGDTPASAGDGNPTNRALGGAGGFKLVGIVVGTFVHSQPLGMAMGAVGASRSIYRNFLRRGNELVFPKNTAMDISVGGKPAPPGPCSVPAADADSAQVGEAMACNLRLFRIP